MFDSHRPVSACVAFSLAIVLGMLIGCEGSKGLIGEPVPNNPPETKVTGTPPALGRTSFQVEFFWTGADRDGEVVGFEWRISENGRDGVVDIADTLETVLPWRWTAATDSTFLVQASLDSFPPDISDSTLGDFAYRFWQSHTFFIRSVDDQGKRDPTPAHVSFTATTIAPSVTLEYPTYTPSNQCTSGPAVLTFGWTTEDPDYRDGDATHVRWLMLPVTSCMTEAEFASESPIRGDDPGWSSWLPYDKRDDLTRRVTLPRLPVGTTVLFAVQARDVAGAVTPVLQWGINVRHIRIGSAHFPELFVRETFLGEETFVADRNIKSFDLAQGQELRFDWNADASDYGGSIEAYRFGWNLADPDNPNDPGWAVNWGSGPSWERARPLDFSEGSPNVVIQCRDNSGAVTRVLYQFRVVPLLTRADQRGLLLVDDWSLPSTPLTTPLEVEWDERWLELLQTQVPGFLTSDVIDADSDPRRLTFETVREYQNVIWFLGPSTGSFFFRELSYDNSEGNRNLNWLELYQRSAGNILFVGPGAMYGSLGYTARVRGNDALRLPIVLSSTSHYPDGMGTVRSNVSGQRRTLGMERWAYTGWCLELLDYVRPPPSRIYGENANLRRRSAECDGLQKAVVSPGFLQAFPSAGGSVIDLEPRDERTERNSLYKLEFEEFYNFNTTGRQVTLTLRDCQTPMYLHRSRRGEGLVENAELECYPRDSIQSSLDGAPIAIVSSMYSSQKPLVGAVDFVWGFHPHGFQFEEVRSTLSWILNDAWELEP